MKNGLPAPNKELSANQKHYLTGKAPYKFESLFLHRRVCLTSTFHGCRRKDPAFAGSVSLDETSLRWRKLTRLRVLRDWAGTSPIRLLATPRFLYYIARAG